MALSLCVASPAHTVRWRDNVPSGGQDTFDADIAQGQPVDCRTYGVGAQIVGDSGIRRLRLITNNPTRYGGLGGYGLDIVGRVVLPVQETAHNLRYLRTRRPRMHHDLVLRRDAGPGTRSAGDARRPVPAGVAWG